MDLIQAYIAYMLTWSTDYVIRVNSLSDIQTLIRWIRLSYLQEPTAGLETGESSQHRHSLFQLRHRSTFGSMHRPRM
jgi:hypothetical protein